MIKKISNTLIIIILINLFSSLFVIFLHADEDKKEDVKPRVSLKQKMKPWRLKIRELIAKQKGYVYKLTHPDSEVITDSEDSKLLTEAINRFFTKEWLQVNEILKKLILEHPKSNHLERAYFLLALSIDKYTREQLPVDYPTIVKNYRKAIEKFPESEYVPHVNASIGDLFFDIGKYYDSLLYYELAKSKKFEKNPKVLLKQGIAYSLVGKFDEAISIYDQVITKYPKSNYVLKSKCEKAKALYQKKSYTQSIELLNDIINIEPDEIYKNSDILLYSGYNFYETGQFLKAKESLLRILNYFPDIEVNHLILTRIADIYTEEGELAKAVKLYNWIMNTYPGTDGGLISALRLVEHVNVDPEKRFSRRVISEITFNKIPVEMYEDIIIKHENSPLAHLAMLKMAIQKHHEKNYEGSIESLKKILTKYPDTPLRQDIRVALRASITEMVRRDYKKGYAENVISIYNKYMDLLTLDDMNGDFMIMLANSYLKLNFFRRSKEMYESSKRHFMKKEWPADLIFGLGESFYFAKRYNEAMVHYKDFIAKFPQERRIPIAYYRTGRIQYDDKEYEKAIRTFELALQNRPDKEYVLDILILLGRALRINERYSRSVKVLKERIELFSETKDLPKDTIYDTYFELGESYYKLGDKKNGALAFEKALKFSKKGERFIRTQFRLAQCYQHLEVSDKAEKILSSIVEANDPFWSKVAKAKIQEIKMNKKLEKFQERTSG